MEIDSHVRNCNSAESNYYYNSKQKESTISSEFIPEMSCQLKRLSTFNNWPGMALKLISVVMLANSGLFFTGINDQLQCYMCGALTWGWTDEDDLFEKHRRACGHCSLLPKSRTDKNERLTRTINFEDAYCYGKPNDKNLLQRNDYAKPSAGSTINDIASTERLLNGTFDIQIEGTVERRNVQPNIEHCDYTILTNRTSSFVDNWSNCMPVNPEDLANAGLYFTGPGDRVQCAYCRGGLYNWENGDIPFEEHMKHFPQCSFVLSNSSFINDEQFYKTTQNSYNQSQSFLEENRESHDDRADYVDTNMGFPQDMTVSQETLNQIQEPEELTIHSQTNVEGGAWGGYHTTIGTNGEEEMQKTGNYSSANHSYSKQSSNEELEELREENRTLKETTRCKVCLENDVVMLFLPCRHLSCCERCSNSVKNCPMCRSDIVATVKSFLC